MATEFAASVASNALGNLAVEYTSAYVRYFFRFGKIVEDFRNQSQKLEFAIYRLQNEVDEAQTQTLIIEHVVEDWLTKARDELKDVQSLMEEVESKKCFRWCPAWGWRYCLSKKVAKKTLSVSKLVETCNFQRVGHRAALPGLEFIPSKDFMPSKSADSAFKEIMEALNNVNMIGLYGMGGVGKTTLAKEVGRQAKAKQLFDEVVIVTVSQTPNISNIQDKIADMLHLKFEKTTVEGRAEELWLRIKNVKKILVILDDAWEELDLKDVGIPFGDDHNGCKIFLTTRLKQVCSRMNCQKDVELSILSENEAWTLFKDNAGLNGVSSPLNDVAKEVARECKGLPLAIVTVGRALKGETLEGWEVVYLRLKDSRHKENQDVCGGIYNSLKISYDYLKNDNSRSCLQLCSLFPEDHEIRIEELTSYGIGQGMFDVVDLIEDARREMRVIITNLQKSGLLLKTSDERCVKMHDVVRDFVHWMTSEGTNTFMIKSGLKEWPRNRCYKAISLINSRINILPDQLELPNLETLLLDNDKSRTRVSITFFEGMKSLKVLVLRSVILSLEGLQDLTELRTLYLEYCELENASALGNLKALEILVIHFCPLKMMPYQLCQLTTLRLLVISCSTRLWIPQSLRPRLERLEELHLSFDIKWGFKSLQKLCSSPRLTSLSFKVSPDRIPKSFVFPPLHSFNIIVDKDLDDAYTTSRRLLKIRGFSMNAFKKLFQNVEELTVHNTMDSEYLIDTTQEQGPNSAAFTNLVKLDLKNMGCMKELCHGRFPIGFLQKLEVLTIRRCDDLIIAIPSVENIKEVSVICCTKLHVVFQIDELCHATEENQTSLLSNLTNLELGSLPELRCIWKGPPHLFNLQSLKVIKIWQCHKLTSLCSVIIAQCLVHLELLKIFMCNELEYIITKVQTNENEVVHPLCWPKLKTLIISHCPKLRYMFPVFTAEGFPQLEKVQLWDLAQLKQVFSPTEERDGDDNLLNLLAVQKLSICNCPQLITCFSVQD